MKKVLIFIFVILTIFLFVFLYFSAMKSVNEKADIKISQTIFTVEIAQTDKERAKGLAGRQSIGDKEGMIFIFNSQGIYNFWMKGMNFPIDIIWISGDKIIGFSENLPPDNSLSPSIYWPPAPVDKVLEISAGAVKKYNVKAGDNISFR